MASYQFDRESRTPHSEAFVIRSDGAEIGRVDLHYGQDMAYGTLCVPEDYSEDQLQELIAEVDERLVMSAVPFRDDFIVTVWMGRMAGVFSEDFEEEDLEGDGHYE